MDLYKSGGSMKKHGLSNKSSEYRTWVGMKQRCYNPNDPSYKSYGGRGITIDKGWMESFELFLKDVGYKPTPKHSLDRIDNNRNYEPSNCKWATQKEQTNNTRRNKLIEVNGVKLSIAECSKIYGIKYTTLTARLRANKNNTSFRTGRNYVFYTYLGQVLTASEWRDRININKKTFYKKLKQMDIEDIIQKYLNDEYRNLIF
jgi:hypothetical protein